MDPQLVQFAQTAGTTVVALMATEAWSATHDRVVALWRRFRPAGVENVEAALQIGITLRTRSPAAVAFSPDGRTLAISTGDSVGLWTVDLPDPARAIRNTCEAVTHPVSALARTLLEQTAERAEPEASAFTLTHDPADPRHRAHCVPVRTDNHGQQRCDAPPTSTSRRKCMCRSEA
ncbi:hypothetical protein [Streptomyces lincolnensis]|uniref:hypothetical protein n=1 Tax=Streptomyces lincolnensis TaxID=1915 RepID=UPI0008372AA6|nr:hypothetical protein [Streptomyces lincolnensis]QMV07892.1 hypothetical protein GJU35_20950 [Streptomyces lincolnensis]